MSVDEAHMFVLTELVLLLLLESNVMTKLIEVSRLAFTGANTPIVRSSAGIVETPENRTA